MKQPPIALSTQTAVEWVVDALGCDEAALCKLRGLKAICERIVVDLGLHVLGSPRWHQFPSSAGDSAMGGITGMLLLAESHLTCHTFPEHRVATWNLYCCRPRPTWNWESQLRQALAADEVVVRFLERGPALASNIGGEPA